MQIIVDEEKAMAIFKSASPELQQSFNTFFEQIETCKAVADTINVTDVSQVEDMQLAREKRLELKAIRVAVEKKRVELKAEFIRKGKAIEGMANIFKELIISTEKRLEDQEKFAINLEQKKKEERLNIRLSELSQYDVDTSYINLVEMPDDMYAKLLATSKAEFNQRIQDEKKAEQERIEAERIEAERIEKLRIDNERLQIEVVERDRIEQERIAIEEKERLEREEKQRIEREKIEVEQHKKDQAVQLERERVQAEHDKKIEAERKEREKIEAELQKRKNEEARIKREQEEKARNLRLAPDKEKLTALANDIMKISMPELESEAGRKIIGTVNQQLSQSISFIKNEILKL